MRQLERHRAGRIEKRGEGEGYEEGAGRYAQLLAGKAGDHPDGQHRDERQWRHRLEPGMRRHARPVVPAEMGDERCKARDENDAQILHEGDEPRIGAVGFRRQRFLRRFHAANLNQQANHPLHAH